MRVKTFVSTDAGRLSNNINKYIETENISDNEIHDIKFNTYVRYNGAEHSAMLIIKDKEHKKIKDIDVNHVCTKCGKEAIEERDIKNCAGHYEWIDTYYHCECGNIDHEKFIIK